MKKKKIIVGLIILVAILAVAVYWFLSSSGTGSMRGGYYESETSRLGNIATYYNFTGNVAVKESQQAAAYSAATVREIYVAEGDVVAKGDALARLSDGTLLSAEIAGEVTAVNASVDEAVAAGSPVIEIVDFDALEIIVKIDEYDERSAVVTIRSGAGGVNAVAVGDEALVTVDALGESFEGQITRISKIAQQSGDVAYFEATIAAEAEVELLPGMKVSAKVLNESVENVVVVSMDALQFDAYNQPYVLKLSGREYVQVPVTVGINDGTSVQILSGVSAGETVYIRRSVLDMMGMTGG